jgi:hypothetical protein
LFDIIKLGFSGYQHPPDPATNKYYRHGQLIGVSHQHPETPVAMRRQNRLHFDEARMVHEIDRVEAEKRLESMRIGDYLLRRRPDGNFAVSLRATDTIMV